MSGFDGMLHAARIDEDGEVSGIVRGELTVAAGRRVIMSGIVDGRLVVEPGADVTVTGIVNGGIDDRGGTVRVSGLVAAR